MSYAPKSVPTPLKAKSAVEFDKDLYERIAEMITRCEEISIRAKAAREAGEIACEKARILLLRITEKHFGTERKN